MPRVGTEVSTIIYFLLPHILMTPSRWLVLKDSYLAFLESDTRSVADVLLFDHPMTIEIGIRRTGARFGLKITNPTRYNNI